MNQRIMSLLLLAFLPHFIVAQKNTQPARYPSLLWEISGGGLKKPSYLFGTMHVSSKIAFHLADSFYYGIRKADIVALETNPESWQEDMIAFTSSIGSNGRYSPVPNDFITINTLKFYKYDKKIARSLYSHPTTINNLLYRSYGNENSDFEEDTYLDMYIYQVGKKWGKKVAGVENYGESMRLVRDAYKDALKERGKKTRRSEIDDEYSVSKLQEAYRKGDLDQLDSIHKLNSFSEAFDEKFLYKRNEIQAESIDSILKSGASVFAGVGAAHLPGSRGVIELLRKMGYRLRPVKMGERDSRYKDDITRLRVPVQFKTQNSPDGLFRVDVPGKFYKFGEDGALEQRQFADMANGSYYMVTRIMTNAWLWGHQTEDVYKKIDSLLYENIPGKLIKKTRIERDGYKGYDVTNRTRRGDVQRYNIYVTPFEIIFFKMGGNGDYVTEGTEANKFFSSIHFSSYGNGTWKKYSPPFGGFSISLPHSPYIGNDGSWIFDAFDKKNNRYYRVIRSDIHNYHFIEEDTFDLALMEESFGSSEFIGDLISRKQFNYKGYPALESKFSGKPGGVYKALFLIAGPHYYSLITFGNEADTSTENFFNSFSIEPYNYKVAKERTDTLMYYTVQSPVFPEGKKDGFDLSDFPLFGEQEEDTLDEKVQLADGVQRSNIILDDSTGESIYVSFSTHSRYYYKKDSSNGDELNLSFMEPVKIRKYAKEYLTNGGMKVNEFKITDTASSRVFWIKRFRKNGVNYSLVTQTDTLTAPGNFLETFFKTFTPADTLKGTDIFTKKSGIFFADFLSKDSAMHRQAVNNISVIELDSSDLPLLKKAVNSITFREKDYISLKRSLIGKLHNVRTKDATDFLKEVYLSAGDTITLQYAALETMLKQQTPYAYNTFRDIMKNETPVLEKNWGTDWQYPSQDRLNSQFEFEDNGFMDELRDSLELTRTILPGLLPLINLEDYKISIMNLLAELIDSNLVRHDDYDKYFDKFLLEARLLLKKQAIAEKRRQIEIAENSKVNFEEDEDFQVKSTNKGNEELELYSTLLIPFWERYPSVSQLIGQLLSSSDQRIKYNTLVRLIRKKKPYPDSLLKYFASLDEYRFELHNDLQQNGKLNLFPREYNNHIDLARSQLIGMRPFSKPDSMVYIDRLPATIGNKAGFVYFFKYKPKKDDLHWKLASVGLVPRDSLQFDFWKVSHVQQGIKRSGNLYDQSFLKYDLTSLSETRLDEEKPISVQLQKALRKLLYSKRRSASEFYGDDSDPDDYTRVRSGDYP